MPDIKNIADKADIIVNGYAFTRKDDRIHVSSKKETKKVFSNIPRPLLAKRGSTSPCIPFDRLSTSVATRQSTSKLYFALTAP